MLSDYMREFLRFLLVGFVSGWIAGIVVRGRIFPRGCLGFVIVGIIGALIGGYIFQALGLPDVAGVVSATIGAIVVLVLAQVLKNQ